MRNVLKSSTLENKFPLFSVEKDCIISKNADVTVSFRLELPELFTVTTAEYRMIHAAWVKALRVLPCYSIVHKQDWFIKENYKADIERYDQSFLNRSYELHFNERPFLNHYSYLFLTKTTKEKSREQSNFNTLCRGFLLPKEIKPEAIDEFLEAVEQFKQIINDSGFLKLSRIREEEIIGTPENAGIIERYFALKQSGSVVLEDIELRPDQMRIGDKMMILHTLSDLDDIAGRVSTNARFEKLSTDRSDCRLSFAAPVGLLLSCNHIYNQYVFLDNSEENLRHFEKSAKNLLSLSRYSRANQINKEWVDIYLNEAHSKSLISVRCHCNVISWGKSMDELHRCKNDVGSQLAMMDCTPHHNTTDLPAIFWAGIPGNAADMPSEETFYTFTEQALCFFVEETNYKSSLSPVGVKMADRISGRPLHVDLSDLPMKMGLITNRNKFIIGGSGTGKSFFTNHYVRNYYEQGSHIVLIDTGNSYQGLCTLIHQMTNGEDGIYYTYTEENPISFNPFFSENRGEYDIEKKESIKTLLLTLWKRETEEIKKSEEVALSNAVNLYIQKIKCDSSIEPIFDTFYEFLKTDYKQIIQTKNVKEKDFDIDNFLNVLEPFYEGGEYHFLLNSTTQVNLLTKRFVVFELDNIKDHTVLLPVVTIVIMEAFLAKMRKLKGVRKIILIEEAWKAIARDGMANYMKYLFKTVRKYLGEAVIITQEINDIISSPIVKESIISNSDCKILLDQRKYINKFQTIQDLLGLTDKEKDQILSINLANHPGRKYKEVWIGLGPKSAVYATEVSLEEYYTFTTEETEKLEVMQLTEKLGGDFIGAIKQIADRKRDQL